jgi:hypothetical protein
MRRVGHKIVTLLLVTSHFVLKVWSNDLVFTVTVEVTRYNLAKIRK